MFWSGRWLRLLLKPVHCQLLVLRRYLQRGGEGGRPPAAVTDSEIPQESLICDFACRSPENIDTLYLKVVVIPSSPKRTIMKKIDLYNYDENYVADQDKWEVDSDGEVGPFFGAIADEKEFDDDRENPVSKGGEGATEVKYQARKLITLSNDKIDAMKKDQLYADILQRGIKEKKSTTKKSIKELLKAAMQNRVRNFTMDEAQKILWHIF